MFESIQTSQSRWAKVNHVGSQHAKGPCGWQTRAWGVVVVCPFAVYPISILKCEMCFEGELDAVRIRSCWMHWIYLELHWLLPEFMVSSGLSLAKCLFYSFQYETSFHCISAWRSSKPSVSLLRKTPQSYIQDVWFVLIEFISYSPVPTSHHYLPPTVYLLARLHIFGALKA